MIVSDFKGYKWEIGTLQLLKVHPWCSIHDCADFLDAIVKTIDYFWTTGYRCIKEKSLDPLLFEDQTIQKFETDYTEVITKKTLVANGNLGEDLPAYQAKVRELISQAKRMKNISYDGWLGHDLHQKLVALCQIDERLILLEKSATLRITPFATSLFGDSSIGKSTLTTLLTKTVSHAMGFEYNPRHCIQLDMKQKFEDAAQSDTQVIGFDDVANPKFGTTTINPTIPIKKYINTTEASAEMSDVTQKGRVKPRPYYCWATTNKKNLDAPLYSNCPESILRCFLHVTMVVNPKYRKADSVMLNNKHPELLSRDLHSPPDDVWTFTIEECHTYTNPNGTTGWDWFPHEGRLQNGCPVNCEELRLSEFLEVISVAAASHMKAETRNLQYNNSLVGLNLCACGLLPGFCKCDTPLIDFCEKCKKTPLMCLCALKKDDSKESHKPCSFEVDKYAKKIATEAIAGYFSSFFRFGGLELPLIKSMATKQLVSETQDMIADSMTPILLSILPQSIVRNPWIQNQINYMYHQRVRRDARWYVTWFFRVLWFIHLFFLCLAPTILVATVFVHMLSSAAYYVYRKCLVKAMWYELSERRDALPTAVTMFRDSRYGVSSLIFGIGAGVSLLRLYNEYRKPQSEEKDHLSKESIDAQPSWFDNMFGHSSLKVETSTEAKTAILSQVEPILTKALWAGDFHRHDSTVPHTAAVCIDKHIVIFPRHNFYKNADMSTEPYPVLSIQLKRNDKPGGVLRMFKAEFETVYHFPGTDFVAAYVPNCPDMKDIRKWLPLSLPTGTADIRILWRNSTSDIEAEKSLASFGTHSHSQMSFPGCSYSSNNPVSNEGSCSSMILGAGKQPTLLGFHLGCRAEKKLGIPTGKWDCVAGTLTRAQCDTAVDYLRKQFPIGVSGGDLPTTQYGMEVLRSPKAHEKAYPGTFDETAGFEIYGSTHVRAQTKSRVIDSPLKPFIKEIFKPDVDFGPPQMIPNWTPYNTTLDHASKPEMSYPPKLLQRAKEDWLRPLLILVKKHVAGPSEVFRKLTLTESIIGVRGKRFIDPLDMSTSMGFPILGPKNVWFEEVLDEKGTLIDRIPDPSIVEEMDRMLACWAKGERAYPIMRACLKDEPTPVGKDKVRVFQSCPIAFSILVRQYFLPVIRFIGCHPRETECSVGINCFSPQWEELMTYAEKYGTERTLAFDYSKYDITCCSQVTAMALQAMIDLAEEGGYPVEDLTIMRAMLTEIVHPMIDWNGTLLQFFSMVISGINLTVQMNSIANSFYMRMHFFAMYRDALDFRSAQAVTTYGDDGYGTVHPDYPKITFTSYQAWLAKYGKKITPPDKTAEAVDYLPGSDFLKRNSAYIPEIGMRIGCLDEASHFKSLMCNLSSKVETPEDVARSSIASVMHEAFALGRERYEYWQENLKKVCECADILCPILNVTFDERVEAWKEKYGPSLGPNPETNENLLT